MRSVYYNDIIDYIDNKYSDLGNTTRHIDDLIHSFLVETYKSIAHKAKKTDNRK